MEPEENEQILLGLEVELVALRTLVVVLTHRLIAADPAFKSNLLGGFSGAAEVFLSDELLAEQGDRAVRLNVALDDLRDRISRL